MRALPVTFAVLLVLSSVAAAAGTTATPPDTAAPLQTADSLRGGPVVDEETRQVAPSRGLVTNETAQEEALGVLGIPPSAVRRSTLETRTVDLGPALSVESNATAAHMETVRRIDRIESASTVERRQQLLLGELSNIEQRVIDLRARQRRVLSAYSAGEISSRKLLLELAIIDVQASELEQRRDRIEEIALQTPDFSITERSADLERELETFTGPVRSHAVQVFSGEAESSRFFVQSGPDSVVLGVIDNGTYVREAYRGTLRQRGAASITTPEALNITAEAYPNIYALRLAQNGTDVVGSGDSYLVRIQHHRGQLSAFVDSGAKTVFKEYQHRPLDTMETTEAGTSVKDGLKLTAYRTYSGGPVLIQLNDSETGEPVDARITVGPAGGRSTSVGRTGDDGQLWALAPGQSYQITAIDDISVVLLSVDASEPPRIHDGATNRTTATPEA
ncbi:DUF7094 domain-containing protein [Halopelagius longus]|uniref:Uncharacterized protein n=1 Tax=Halopelagius longus TaxID=1236180 RepID=A0A1H1E3J3_9EURY|nr:hypothetical protein [Halopelagius longus]RDI71592.1 hypothetical protein DWB78_07560 [Halopelagius longus]SDQ83325.1 hypothetical protein SAMN05216278_2719 [Halopelagius longus]